MFPFHLEVGGLVLSIEKDANAAPGSTDKYDAITTEEILPLMGAYFTMVGSVPGTPPAKPATPNTPASPAKK